MSQTENYAIKGSLIAYFSNLVKTKGGINLAQGVPNFNPPKQLLENLSNIIHDNYHQYAPGAGNLELVKLLTKEYDLENNNSKIIITNGATEAISLLYNLIMSKYNKNEFSVATFSPAYESYIHLPKIFNHKLYTYNLLIHEDFNKDDFENFFQANNIKLLFVASPGNPYGKIIKQDDFDFLVQLAEKNNAYIIIDAVYRDLYFNDNKPYYPIKNISDKVFYVNSFSKKFSITGWRLGYVVFNSKHFETLSYIHDYIGLCASSLLQQALANFINNGNSEKYITELRKTIDSNYNLAYSFFENTGFKCSKAEGGYFVWCKLPDKYTKTCLDFGLELYDKTQTAIVPGIHFGNSFDRYIRINIAQQKQILEDGLKNLMSII